MYILLLSLPISLSLSLSLSTISLSVPSFPFLSRSVAHPPQSVISFSSVSKVASHSGCLCLSMSTPLFLDSSQSSRAPLYSFSCCSLCLFVQPCSHTHSLSPHTLCYFTKQGEKSLENKQAYGCSAKIGNKNYPP